MLVAQHPPPQQRDDRSHSRSINTPLRPLIGLRATNRGYNHEQKLTAPSPASDGILHPSQQFDTVWWSSLTYDYRSAAVAWLTKGTGIGAVLAMPLGPVGFLVGALVGCAVTLSLGLVTDSVRIRRKKREAEIEGAICAVADHNKTAQSLVKRLREFLERNEVQNCAAEYWDLFIEGWREADPDEIATFQTVVHKEKRWPDIYYRMNQCQKAQIVQDLFSQASKERKRIWEKAKKDKDWVTYADVGDQRAEDIFRSHFQRKFGLRRWKSTSSNRLSYPKDAELPHTAPVVDEDVNTIEQLPLDCSNTSNALHVCGNGEFRSTSKSIGSFFTTEKPPKVRERHHTMDIHMFSSHGNHRGTLLPVVPEQHVTLRAISDTVGLRTKSVGAGGGGLYGIGNVVQHTSLKVPEKIPHLLFETSTPWLPSSEERSREGSVEVVDSSHRLMMRDCETDGHVSSTTGNMIAERPLPSESSSLYISIAGDDSGPTKDILSKNSLSILSRLESDTSRDNFSISRAGELAISAVGSAVSSQNSRDDTRQQGSVVEKPPAPDHEESLTHVALSVAEAPAEKPASPPSHDVQVKLTPDETRLSDSRPTAVSQPPAPLTPHESHRNGITTREIIPVAVDSHATDAEKISAAPNRGAASTLSVPIEEEKRFFKSLQDLRDFSPELKHKIPIGLYEFEFLNDTFPETPLGRWELVAIRNEVRIYKQIVAVKGSDLVMVKGYVKFEDISVENVLHNIRDTVRRSQWDTTFDAFTLIEGDVRGNEVVYNSIHAPWPVADRDFLQWRRTVIDPDTGVVKILHRSAEHPAKPEDKSGNTIRAESIISAYIITPKGPTSCELFLLTQCDVKGTIPRWLVNATAAKAPFSWVENLRSACREFNKKRMPIPKYNPKPSCLNGVPVVPSH